MELINIRGLEWRPGAELVLAGISLEFRQGVFYGIIGPNGSGKTSLVRHIMRVLEPGRDVLSLNGADIRDYRRGELGRVMSWVPQHTYIEAGFTAQDIVMMGRIPYQQAFKPESQEDRCITREAMETTGVWGLRDNAFGTLSGGEAQRVIAARAIAQDTPIILLDEPVSNLDIRHQKELMETMASLNRGRGKTVLAVLHDLNLAARYCGELILLHNGEVFAQGAPESVLTEENLAEVYGIAFHRAVHPSTGGVYLIPE